MTRVMILKQACGLLGDEKRAATADADDAGLAMVNQIYGELWSREHRTAFTPLDALQQPLLLPCRFMPALAYGTAMLLCADGEAQALHDRFLSLYHRAASHAGGSFAKREDVLWKNREV